MNICGAINEYLRNKKRMDTRLKFYKIIAMPIWLYGSESWFLNRGHEDFIQAVEMKFLRTVAGC